MQLLRSVLDDLKPHVNPWHRWCNLGQDTPTANALSARTGDWLRRYRIDVSPHLVGMLADVAEVCGGSISIEPPAGKLWLASPLSESRVRTAMELAIVQHYYDARQWWSDYSGMDVIRARRLFLEARVSRKYRRSYLIGRLFYQATLFVMAHELAHIVYGHVNRDEPDAQEERWKEEYDADQGAAGLVLRWVRDHYPATRNPEQYLLAMSYSVVAVALVLGIWGAIEHAGERLGASHSSHPPPNFRWKRFRNTLIGAGIPEELFAEPTKTFLGSPDAWAEWLSTMTGPIDWPEAMSQFLRDKDQLLQVALAELEGEIVGRHTAIIAALQRRPSNDR